MEILGFWRMVVRGGAVALAVTALVGCSRAGNSELASDVPKFDAERAYALLKKQVDFGPRVPGSAGHDKCAEFIVSELKGRADAVSTQDFDVAVAGKTLKLRNIAATFKGKSGRWVLLCAHWDTRPTADLEVDAAKRKQPIPGANDGASGVAVLLELARMFAAKRPRVGVCVVFFDGEDYGPGLEAMLLGSKHFAANLGKYPTADGKPIRFDYGMLLDMVGDTNLSIPQEINSLEAAPDVVEKVWKAARNLGYGKQFVRLAGYRISDDHVPLIGAGVKCIDIIDFDYAYWHTLDDTPDKCSPKSLRAVGETVARVIYDGK